MRGSTSIAICLATIAITAGVTSAQVPLVSQPSPCPCAADGACYPKRDTWGYYRSNWRKWPYDARPDVPGRVLETPPGQLPDELGPVEVPRKEEEDRRAPLSSKEREERRLERENRGAGAPPLAEPPAGGPGGLPELPPARGPQDGGFEFDPPPQLPFGQPPAGGLDGGPGADDEDLFQFPSRGPGNPLNFDSDLPPALPRGLAPQHYNATIANSNRAAQPAASRDGVTRLPYIAADTAGNGARVSPASAQQAIQLRGHRVGRAVFMNPVTDVSR